MDLHRLHGRGWRLGAALLGVALIAGLVPATALAAVGPVFTTQPIGAQSGQPFATQPVVSIKKGANVDASAGGTVALAIKGGTGTAGATLTCTGTGAGGRAVTPATRAAPPPARHRRPSPRRRGVAGVPASPGRPSRS